MILWHWWVRRRGRFPDALRAELLAERVLLMEEGLSGSLTLRNFRRAGRRTSWLRVSLAGAIAVTDRRFVVWEHSEEGRRMHFNVPHGHAMRQAIEVTADRADRVRFVYTAETIRDDWSGEVEVRLRTPSAPRIVELLTRE